MYVALVLDDESKNKLASMFKDRYPADWNTICHHMTINMGDEKKSLSSLDNIEILDPNNLAGSLMDAINRKFNSNSNIKNIDNINIKDINNTDKTNISVNENVTNASKSVPIKIIKQDKIKKINKKSNKNNDEN